MAIDGFFSQAISQNWVRVTNWLTTQKAAKTAQRERINRETRSLPYIVRRSIDRECYGDF
jgi:hypothetical protein